MFADGDKIAGADRTIEQDDETADVICGDFLQSETDAHAEHAAEYRKHGKIDAHGR